MLGIITLSDVLRYLVGEASIGEDYGGPASAPSEIFQPPTPVTPAAAPEEAPAAPPVASPADAAGVPEVAVPPADEETPTA